jgi:hypothetical protein
LAGDFIKAFKMQPKTFQPSKYERFVCVRAVVEGDDLDYEDRPPKRISGRRRETRHYWHVQLRAWTEVFESPDQCFPNRFHSK